MFQFITKKLSIYRLLISIILYPCFILQTSYLRKNTDKSELLSKEKLMTKDKIKEVMDACYQAKRIRDMLPALPGGVTPSHIHYLDTLSKLEKTEGKVKVSDISENLGLPRPSVTKTVKDMEKLGFVEKETTETDGRFVYIKTTRTGRDLVDKYVDEYFGNLSEDLGGITDEDADKMIEVVEKFYIVMSNRK